MERLLAGAVVLTTLCLAPGCRVAPVHVNTWGGRTMLSEQAARDVAFEFLRVIGKDKGRSLEQVRRLLGRAKREEDRGEHWVFKCPLGHLRVSMPGGYVSQYFSPASPDGPPGRQPNETEPELQERATSIVRELVPEFDDGRFVLADARAVSSSVFFRFTQRKLKGEVSIYPGTISVGMTVDDHQVGYYMRRTLPFRRTIPPRVSEAEARRIIEANFPGKDSTIKEIYLEETPVDRATRSVTVWRVRVTYRHVHEIPELTAFATVVYSVNADTGEVLQDDGVDIWNKLDPDSWKKKK